MGKVNLKRAWAVGGSVYRPQNNPNEVPDKYLTKEFLPSTAQVLDEKKAKEISAEREKDAKQEPKALSQVKQDEILPKKG